MKKRRTLTHRLALWFLFPMAMTIYKVLCMTMRVRIVDPHGVAPQASPDARYIYAFWHNQQLNTLRCFKNFGIRILISRSPDGDFGERAAYASGYGVLRASTSSGAISALRGLVRELKAGYHVTVMPDGPRGPVYRAQTGAVHLAALSGHAIAPFGCAVKRVWRLRSWDRFEIPKPFSPAVFVFAEPIPVPRKLSDSQTEEIRRALEETLNRLRDQAAAELTPNGRPKSSCRKSASSVSSSNRDSR